VKASVGLVLVVDWSYTSGGEIGGRKMIESVSSALAKHSLFSELSPADLRELSAHLRRRRCAKGQIVFAQGDPGASLYVVQSGSVVVGLTSSEGKDLVLNEFGPGEVFGELALLDGEPRSADAVAREDSQLLVLQRDDFVLFLEGHPRVAIALLAILSRKLRRTTQQVQDVAFLDVPARLARALLDLSEARGKTAAEGDQASSFRATQSELAGIIGATRESVNKWLGFYQGQGLIDVARGKVTVLNPERLRGRIY
jgi:CRP/FNR family transcriptional regulator, cyclic AMP receptor protein